MKDNFSAQAQGYVQFRPTYPDELVDFVLSLTLSHESAWDCGTGNGQLGAKLADHFKQVFATDISAKQIAQAIQKPNLVYKVEPAEVTSFADASFDLITVAQAIHWFNFDLFYKEVRRTLKPGGALAVIGYGLPKVEGRTGDKIEAFYAQTLGDYWDKERHYIDEGYKTIPFPFEEITTPAFSNQYEWSLDQLTGYLNTWSAVQHFIRQNGTNPVEAFIADLKDNWGAAGSTKLVTFPILLRVGR